MNVACPVRVTCSPSGVRRPARLQAVAYASAHVVPAGGRRLRPPAPGDARRRCSPAARSPTDVCDADPYLLRAARFHGEPTAAACPVCRREDLVELSYIFGDELGQYSGRIKSPAELARMAHEHGEFRVYVVEVCQGCEWNHLTSSYVLGDGVPRRPPRRRHTGRRRLTRPSTPSEPDRAALATRSRPRARTVRIDYPRRGRTGVRRFLPSWRQWLLLVGDRLRAGRRRVRRAVRARSTCPSRTTRPLAADHGRLLRRRQDRARPVRPDRTARRCRSSRCRSALQHAVLAAEDREFYEHGGFSPTGIVRAAWNDLRGGSTQGGSTITQQYVKNAYLTQERTLSAQGQRVLRRGQARAAAVEGPDPRGLPQHHLLRPRRVRRRRPRRRRTSAPTCRA